MKSARHCDASSSLKPHQLCDNAVDMATSSRYVAKNVIHVTDTDGSDSSIGQGNTSKSNKALGKRKAPPVAEEKFEWSDSDDAYAKLKTRRKPARKSRKSNGGEKAKAKKKRDDLGDRVKDLDEASANDDLADAAVPDYLRERRRKFDENRQVLREAGLRLPPDYGDVEFSDDERIGSLRERPVFEPASGIKACRAYKDIDLEYSAGLIPASIAQYLRDYQIDGVKFLHEKFVYQRGCVLGDDMGLGKTVQVAAFLTAAFGKSGDERDAKRMRKMRRMDNRWYPRILIVCPGTLIENWRNELNRWGWWQVDAYHGSNKDETLHAARSGRLEVMITTYGTYRINKGEINMIQWDAVVADECHCLKFRGSEITQAMNDVNSLCRIGLTGTAIQNNYEELWTLLNWTNPGHFGSISEWRESISRPLTIGQAHDATRYQLSLARKTAKKLVQNLLPEFFLRRMKSLIAHQLPKKSDKVVFCPLTEQQSSAYENFLDSYSVRLLREVGEECPCGSGKKQGWCCEQYLPNGKPWISIVFPTMHTLLKLSNHLTLLIPSSGEPSDKQKAELNTLQTCVPDGWEELYKNRDSLVNLANPEFCGKWKILRKLLRFWHENGDKVLIFSHSVRLLRILQHLFHHTSYSVSYLDGSMSYVDRQLAVDDFNSDPNQFVFLISTKAGGTGLNITSANKVVIFDPHWNPSYDLQAQDRAYRIGQTRDVDVFRLVSAGTIEEIVYARQIYKQQQANIGYTASTERRYFKGVQKDKDRKGEIFGLGNLLSFHSDHVVLREIVNKTNIAEAKAGVHLSDIDMEKMGEDSDLGFLKQEDSGNGDDGGLSQLTELLSHENQEAAAEAERANKPKSDAIQAILSSAGVEYTHENSEVVGSSKVEAQLSRRAELAADDDSNIEGQTALFADSQANIVPPDGPQGIRYAYNPPLDVMKRQFCSMAREFGFQNATDFALVVESWTQEQRRNCLNTFYKKREIKLLEKDLEELRALKNEESDDEVGGEVVAQDEDVKMKGDADVLVKDEDVKMEGDAHESKHDNGSPMSNQKQERNGSMALDHHKIKEERVKKEEDEDVPRVSVKQEESKIAGSEKRTSIFLYDTDDDETDEL